MQSSYTERSERMRPLTRNSDVLRGIERWENEGGRIRMETTTSDRLKGSSNSSMRDRLNIR
jgi:hypothetical protein